MNSVYFVKDQSVKKSQFHTDRFSYNSKNTPNYTDYPKLPHFTGHEVSNP
jgi:hypothetical protein